jgi:hypothetical protein
MHFKRNNNQTRTYLQGLRQFNKSLPKSVKSVLKKNGHNYSEIVSKWKNFVNNDIAENSFPKTIKISADGKNCTLVMSIKRGNELLVEYSKKEIINRINAYFGYNFLSDIRLISKNSETGIKKIKKTLKISPHVIEKKVKEIKNQNIQGAFLELINAIKKT